MYNMDFSRVLFFFKVQYQTKIYCSRIKRSCTKFLTFWLQQGAFYTGSSVPLNLQPFQVWIRVLSKQRRRNNRFLEADRFRWCGQQLRNSSQFPLFFSRSEHELHPTRYQHHYALFYYLANFTVSLTFSLLQRQFRPDFPCCKTLYPFFRLSESGKNSGWSYEQPIKPISTKREHF